MSVEPKAGFTGLLTNTGELGAGPGALRIADNVVLRKAAAIETRQGFLPKTHSVTLGASPVYDVAVHGGLMVLRANVTSDRWFSSGGTARLYRPYNFGTLVYPAPLRSDMFAGSFMRGNHYLPHSAGVVRVAAAADTEWKTAGLWPRTTLHQNGGITSSSPGMQPANSIRNYRAILKRKDANGLEVYSRPSGTLSVVRGAGAVTTALAIQSFTENPTHADEVEIYRSRTYPNTIQPDEEMALVVTLPGNLGVTFFYDEVEDSKRGKALYTSPSRGGMENAYDPPPACAATESYRGSLFFGNCAGPHRAVVSYNLPDQSTKATGFGYRTYNGTATSGSPTITGMASTVGLRVGQVVLPPAPGAYPVTTSAGVYITAIVGSTLTLSANWPTATIAAGPLVFYDSFEVNGVVIAPTVAYAVGPRENLPPVLNVYSNSGAAAGMSVWSLTPSAQGKQYTHVVERMARGGSAWTLRATNGDDIYPPVPEYGTAPSYASQADAYPNQLVWSQPDEPEHVPQKNYMFIGDKKKAILGIIATRDSLFVFKEDGIWRLSGYEGDWTVDPFDMTTFVVLPSSIKRMNNRIYALTNKGVVAVDEMGVEILSEPINNEALKLVDACRTNNGTLGYYKLDGYDGVAATVDERNSEYLLATGTVIDSTTQPVLVYNAITGAWTRFVYSLTFTPTGLSTAPTGEPLALHSGGVRAATYATLSAALAGEVSAITSDIANAITVTPTTVSGRVRIAQPTSSMQIGDIVAIPASGILAAVRTIVSTTVVELDWTDAYTPATGTPATHYRPITATVQPHGFSTPAVSGKEWLHVAWAFSRFVGVTSISATYSGATRLASQDAQLTTAPIVDIPLTHGFSANYLGTLLHQIVPLNYSHSWLLRVGIVWQQAFGSAVLEMVAADERSGEPNRPGFHSR